ncbi:major facilitator superfamily domain-containing protein [Amanita rubescens]|nr:major facilitator superfamily domain-containing protein [Amanita rubescens]
MSAIEQQCVDEETPLLYDGKRPLHTPLPKFQLAILLFSQFCEPMTSISIFPYINQLITELDITGGDKAKIGYYAGLIESFYYVAEASTVLQWGRISDRIGRKPVLLMGMLGGALSMVCFGVSRTFLTLVISRCVCGILNGNIGVMKSAVGELLDVTNRAEGFAFIPIVWSIGATIAPVVGGGLARPHERFPAYFKSDFWRVYPYFLSCLGAASFVVASFLVAFFFLEETSPRHRKRKPFVMLSEEHSKPLPLREILTYPVVLSVSNYVTLAFLEIMFTSLVPLFMAMPIELGGLGFTPMVIGSLLGILGAYTGVFQVLFFARLVRRFGPRGLFIVGMLTFCVYSVIYPLINIVARRTGVTWAVWSLLFIPLFLYPIKDMCYSCIFIYIVASSPNKSSLGTTNGISQMTVSIARATGPTLATSLFSYSIERNVLGGYAVYAIIFVLSCLALIPAVWLPTKPWDECDSKE